MFCFPWESPASDSRLDNVQPSGATMPEQQQSRSQRRGNQCNRTDVMQRISLSKPPVDLGMYRTLYMKDYQPYSDNYQQSHARVVDHMEEKLTLETQLKAKEFTWPIKYEPVKYAEDPACREVQPPYPTVKERRLGRGQSTPRPSQPVKEVHQEDFHAALPSPQNCLPPVESIAIQGKEEAERLSQQTQPSAMPSSTDVPCVKHELGQNWDNYQQFILETQRASHTRTQEIKKLNLGCSAFSRDFRSGTEASTYQKDYKHWLRVHRGFCRAHRNFSNLLFDDGSYNENPWMSEYMDNYNIFLQKLNWKWRNPVSSFCSATKPVPHLSPGMPSQTPGAL